MKRLFVNILTAAKICLIRGNKKAKFKYACGPLAKSSSRALVGSGTKFPEAKTTT